MWAARWLGGYTHLRPVYVCSYNTAGAAVGSPPLPPGHEGDRGSDQETEEHRHQKGRMSFGEPKLIADRAFGERKH